MIDNAYILKGWVSYFVRNFFGEENCDINRAQTKLSHNIKKKCTLLRKKMMDKEAFMKMAEAKYAEIHALKDEPTFLDYEKGFV